MKKIISVSLLVLLLFSMLPGLGALAYITAPSSVSISNIAAFQNLAEAGDEFIGFHYSMPYTGDNYSTTPASKSITFALVNSTNGTVYQTRAPFVNPFFDSNGYGEGMGSFYFASTDTNKPVWGEEVEVQIILMPGFFSPTHTEHGPVSASDYYADTSQEANRAALVSYILLECDELGSDYDIVLKTSSDVGIILSQYGELYFKGVTPGLQYLAPDLFFIQSQIPETMTITSYNMTIQTQYTNRLATDDLGRGFDRMGTFFHLSKEAFCGLLCFAFTIGACVWTAKKNWGIEIGMVVGFLFTLCIALLVGGAVFTGIMIFSFLAAIGLVWVLLLKRA